MKFKELMKEEVLTESNINLSNIEFQTPNTGITVNYDGFTPPEEASVFNINFNVSGLNGKIVNIGKEIGLKLYYLLNRTKKGDKINGVFSKEVGKSIINILSKELKKL